MYLVKLPDWCCPYLGLTSPSYGLGYQAAFMPADWIVTILATGKVERFLGTDLQLVGVLT